LQVLGDRPLQGRELGNHVALTTRAYMVAREAQRVCGGGKREERPATPRALRARAASS
jgi:hypothetical protein